MDDMSLQIKYLEDDLGTSKLEKKRLNKDAIIKDNLTTKLQNITVKHEYIKKGFEAFKLNQILEKDESFKVIASYLEQK